MRTGEIQVEHGGVGIFLTSQQPENVAPEIALWDYEASHFSFFYETFNFFRNTPAGDQPALGDVQDKNSCSYTSVLLIRKHI